MMDYNSVAQQTTVEIHESKSEPYRETFFIVPRYVLEMDGMSLTRLKVYESMFQFWNKGRNCWLAEESLVERTGRKRTQIYDALKYLESNGLLRRKNINGKRYLMPGMLLAGDPNVRKTEHPTSGKPDHNIKKGNKENNKKEKLNKKKKVHEDKVSNCTKETKDEGVKSTKKNRGKEVAKYKETLFPMPDGKSLAARPLGGMDLIEMNPFNIPHDLLTDWLAVRAAKKAPVTPRAWSYLNKQLERCENPVEAFEIMVAHGWTSLNHRWIQKIKGVSKKDGHFDDDDTTWADKENWGIFG